MKSASIVSILALLIFLTSAPTYAQDDDLPEGVLPGGVQVPKEYTPTYFCLMVFFGEGFQFYMEHDRLDEILEPIGIPPEAVNTRAHAILLSAKVKSRGSHYASLNRYEDDAEAWHREQHRLIRSEIVQFQQLYNQFRDAAIAEKLDFDFIHEEIVKSGRKHASLAIGGPEMDDRLKESLKLFEAPGSYNPWLE